MQALVENRHPKERKRPLYIFATQANDTKSIQVSGFAMAVYCTLGFNDCRRTLTELAPVLQMVVAAVNDSECPVSSHRKAFAEFPSSQFS